MQGTQTTITGPGRRGDRRKRESRQRILAAARRLFVAEGYHATRPQTIARAADLGHGTFYLHFADKRACFLAFVEQARGELEGAVEARLDGVVGLDARIHATLSAIWDYAGDNPGVLRAAMTELSVIAADDAPEESLHARWGRHWAREIADGVQAGVVAGDYDSEVIGHAIVGLIEQAGAYAQRHRRDRGRVIESLTKFMLRGLAADPGRTSAGDRRRRPGTRR